MNKFSNLLILAFLAIMPSRLLAQESGEEFRVGAGMGINYGGFGIQAGYSPVKTFGAFAGIGYNLEGLGYNVGMTWDFLPEKRVSPTLNFMYGYNAVIVITNADQFNKTYFGPSGGLGARIRVGKNYVDLNLILPIRSSEYDNDYEALKRNTAISLPREASPVLVGLGYHFVF